MLVVLAQVDMVLVIVEQFTLQILLCIVLHLAPLRPHDLKESPLAQVDGNYRLNRCIAIRFLFFGRLPWLSGSWLV